MNKALLDYLLQFVSAHKKALFSEVIAWRTRYLTLVLEDLYHPHNASACLRSADSFGVQDVHIIENENAFHINPKIAVGASQWLTLHYHNQEYENTRNAIKALKAQGYRIVATTPHTKDVALEEFDLSRGRAALLFGGELRGLSATALEYADEYLKIPLLGFTESFNVSVSAALIMHHLTWKLHQSGLPWQLPRDEKYLVMLQWARQAIKRVDLIEKDFYRRRQ